MQEGAEGNKKKRRKKKSKFGYYLYAVVVLALTVANITIATLLLTYVQEIRVTGNETIQKSKILSWIQEDPLTVNSLYTLLALVVPIPYCCKNITIFQSSHTVLNSSDIL